ncbi:hypothetical protein PTB20_001661 [Vibrio alginolyticus]|uniref:hypothetical protein n=1 Tax=Vibrio alginolyticus TaxID=663 RepID=UPI00215BA974|nr:hypothetical protein [Vibrio alginolyticus]EKL9828665.1 hypothetical protein [Vibrio alginolyticus]MCR9490457.1 hypothetical protein [Vibrio alginolyticus]
MFKENSDILKDFITQAKNSSSKHEFLQQRIKDCCTIAEYIVAQPQEWDDRCAYSIGQIGAGFIENISNFDKDNIDQVNIIYVDMYRFLCEFDFLIGEGKEINRILRNMKKEICGRLSEIDDQALKSELTYVSYLLPAQIIKNFISDSRINIKEDFINKVDQADKLRGEWNDELIEKTEKVENLKRTLDKLQNEYNFVGLNQGFEKLEKKKKKEKNISLSILILMGLLLLAPLVYEFLAIQNKEMNFNDLIAFIPLVSIEIILIYFFRVILIHYKEVKTQIMQIELRMTLCQFIESYTSYSKEIKEQDSNALEKFENIIFSGILSDTEKLPSTFDGFEQLGSLVKSLKQA